MAEIRRISKQDLPALKDIIDSNQLFPSDLLDDMTSDFFGDKASSDIWLTREESSRPVAVAFCAPEKMTEGTYNLYLIAIHKDFQGKGMGAEIMNHVEDLLRKENQRILIVETSGLPEFELTRKFYDNLGYHREAVIREFYQAGEDKIVFWKKLN